MPVPQVRARSQPAKKKSVPQRKQPDDDEGLSEDDYELQDDRFASPAEVPEDDELDVEEDDDIDDENDSRDALEAIRRSVSDLHIL